VAGAFDFIEDGKDAVAAFHRGIQKESKAGGVPEDHGGGDLLLQSSPFVIEVVYGAILDRRGPNDPHVDSGQLQVGSQIDAIDTGHGSEVGGEFAMQDFAELTSEEFADAFDADGGHEDRRWRYSFWGTFSMV